MGASAEFPGRNSSSSKMSSLNKVWRLTSSVSRSYATSTAVRAAAASDPIQKLFVDKVQSYAQKKKASGGKLVDATKETEAALQAELDKVAAQYGGGKGVDMTKFPDFKWVEPNVEIPEMK